MLNGFLLFTVVDVWRMLLPLGLSLVLMGTLLFDRWRTASFNGGLSVFLLPITARAIISFLLISILVGIFIPWIIGFLFPVSHLSSIPWSYEEIGGFLLAAVCLWPVCRNARRRNRVALFPVGIAAGLLLFAGLMWVARWDMMAHGEVFDSGMMIGNLLSCEWSQVVPKFFHLIFSSFVAGGLVVVGLGLFHWSSWCHSEDQDKPDSSMEDSQTVRYGVGWTLSGLVPQMVIGPWLFLVLGEGSRGNLIDGMSLTSLIFFVSLTAYLLALVLLNASFMVPYVTGLAWGGLFSALTTIVLMGVIRYAMFGATTHSHHIPMALDPITLLHVGSVVLVVGLLLIVFVRWCVWPLSAVASLTARLDK